MSVSRLENMPDTWLRPGRSDLSCTDTGTIATSVLSGSSSRSSRNRRSTPATSAITTSLTLTPKWFLTVLMSSRSSWAKAMLRRPVTLALNARLGRGERRRHRQAVARPLDGVDDRRRASTARTLTSFSGRVANLIAPLTAISRSDSRRRRPSTGSGGGRVGFGGAQLRHQVGAGDAVDAGVVHLGQHREPAAVVRVGARDVLDDPHLPQRPGCGPAVSEAMCPQISPSSTRPPGDGRPMRCRCRSTSKSLSSTHTGWSRLNRLSASFSRNSRHRLDAQAQCVAHPVEGVAAGNGRRVDLQDRAHVQRLCGGFEVEEAGVESAEPLHVADVRPASGPGVRKSTSPTVHLLLPGVTDLVVSEDPGTRMGLEESNRQIEGQ